MAKPRTSSKKPKAPPGHLRCVLCGEAKLLTHFPAEEKTCFECLKTPAPTSEIDIEALETTPETSQELSIALPAAEIDYDNPTTAELAARTLCRRNLLQFIKRFRPKYEAGWVHIDICKRLEQFMRDIEAGKEPRLLLMMPVRMGKSEIASRHFAPYILGHHPDWEIIAASGAQSLATSFSRYIRDLLRNDSYQALFPVTALDPQSQSVENWNTTMGGGYLAAGTGTMITGRGAHCVVPYCTVDTIHGTIPIANLRVGDRVYGYDHENNRVTETEIVAVSASVRSTPLVAVRDGPVVTDDHRIYNAATGAYQDARLSHGMPALWRAEGPERVDVLGVLLEEQGDEEHHAQLRALREGVPAHTHGASTQRRSRWVGRPFILLSRLYARVQARTSLGVQQGKRAVLALREARSWKQPIEILFPAMLREVPFGTAQFAGVQRRVPSTQGASCSPRQGVSALWGAESTARGASYRPQRGEQLVGKHDATLCALPQKVSSVRGTCARDLADLLPSEDYVVDIQTTTGNFFAAGLLVHNCLIIDDPVKDAEAADSQLIRDNVWEWYISTALSRLAPGGGVLGILTWWNEDDWAGRVQQLSEMEGGDVFEIVKYPAINEQGDEYILTQAPGRPIVQLLPGQTVPEGAVLTRPHNSALHPARYTYEALMRRKKTYYALGQQRWWAALYQQNPTPEEGAYFTKEMFRFFTHRPPAAERNVYQAWDFAITEKAQSDYTVCVTIDQDSMDNLFVVDVTRFRSGDSFVIADAILDCWELHGSCALLGFEDSQIWRSVESVFKKRCEERRLHPAYEVMKPFTDKMVRAQPLRGRMQSGKLMFNQHTAWWDECRMEMLRFPAGKHDDIIDALSWCVRLVLSKVAPRFATKREMKSWKDRLPGLASPKGGAMAA